MLATCKVNFFLEENMTEDMNPTGMDGDVTSDDKLWAFLGYIFPLIAIIVLLMEDKKSRPFLKYHAVQALLIGIVTLILSGVCIGVLVWFYGIYIGWQAYQGQWVVVPVVTDLAKKQGWV
jgi:uncharacterized membrane protein